MFAMKQMIFDYMHTNAKGKQNIKVNYKGLFFLKKKVCLPYKILQQILRLAKLVKIKLIIHSFVQQSLEKKKHKYSRHRVAAYTNLEIKIFEDLNRDMKKIKPRD